MALFYHTYGSGAPLVLLHGYLSDSRYWQALIPELAKHYTVITIDLLGFGKSPKPRSATYTLDEHAAAIAETITHITSEPVTLAGHSMGALVAGQLSATRPELITRTVLCNMPLFRDAKQARGVIMRTGPLYRILLYSPLARIAWPLVKSFFLAKRLAPGPPGAFSIHHTYRSRMLSLANTIEPTSALELLLSISVPTVLINGTYDRRVYRETLATTTLPATITIKWVETGHHTLHQAPHELLDVLISRESL
jgi:pimeloyl-ACP methyl ester carboxylesterase